MTETRFTWKWLLVAAALGVCGGLVVGLLAGWLVFPAAGGGTASIASLGASAQNDYIILVANSYASDDDLPRAKERLAQLNDSNIKARVERLAKSLAARNDPAAANVADLAVALGSTDSSLQVLAASIGDVAAEPTKFAQVNKPPTATPKPTQAPTTTLAPAPTNPPTAPTKAPTEEKQAVATKSPATPKPTSPPPLPPAPAAPPPEIIPDLSLWWDSQYIPANVAPGQQYWRLKYARYCDWVPDGKKDPCEGMPGGPMDHTIYIMALDASGACANNPTIKIAMNDGSVAEYGADKAKNVAYPWYNSPCMTDWEKEMYGEGNTVSVEGFPSDAITNMLMCSKNPPEGYNPPPCGRAHVRYFVVFQLTTR